MISNRDASKCISGLSLLVQYYILISQFRQIEFSLFDVSFNKFKYIFMTKEDVGVILGAYLKRTYIKNIIIIMLNLSLRLSFKIANSFQK